MRIDISQGELLLGRSVGLEIVNAIQNAKESIRIISQQVSPRFAQLLREKKDQGINVRLITTENIVNDCYPHFITRNKHSDEKGITAKKKDTRIAVACLATGLLLLFVKLHFVPYAFLLSALLIIVSLIFFKKRGKHRLHYYTFTQNIDLRVFCVSSKDGLPTNTSKFFVNGKVYIIDDSVAYLGSGNLTEAGMNSNFETFVKISSIEAINALVKEYSSLFNHEELWYYKDEALGALAYGS